MSLKLSHTTNCKSSPHIIMVINGSACLQLKINGMSRETPKHYAKKVSKKNDVSRASKINEQRNIG